MGKLDSRYEQYMPYSDYDSDSVEDILALLQAHTEIVFKKGTNLILREDEYISTRSVHIVPIETEKLTPYHRHEFYEMNYVYSGSVGQYIDGKSFILEKGDLLFMSPSVYHTSHPIGNTTKARNLLFKADYIEHEVSKMRSHTSTSYLQQLVKNSVYYVFKNTDTLGIADIIAELENVIKNGDYYKPFTEMLKKNITEKLLIILNNAEKHSLSYQPPKIKLNKEERDKRIVQYIKDNYSTASLEDISKYFGYSTQQIRRIIKECTGINFAEYIRNMRISKARHYLMNTDMSIAQIAKHVGLESPEYFSRRFKYERGCTPTEYRNTERKKQGKKL